MAREAVNEFGLTGRQEKFAQVFVETGDASAAYRQAYDTSKMNMNSINRKAHEAKNHVKISARIEQLRQVHAKRHNVTVDSLVAELEEIKRIALEAETPQTSAAVSAVMGKAKLTGLDKQVVEMTGVVNVAISPEDVKAFRKAFDKDF
ncbi:terminase small subunit [Phage vB_KsaM-C1]|nr:terminase small subunit [Phage vB_KsaM-C1]